MTYKQAIDVNESYRNDINLKPPIAMGLILPDLQEKWTKNW